LVVAAATHGRRSLRPRLAAAKTIEAGRLSHSVFPVLFQVRAIYRFPLPLREGPGEGEFGSHPFKETAMIEKEHIIDAILEIELQMFLTVKRDYRGLRGLRDDYVFMHYSWLSVQSALLSLFFHPFSMNDSPPADLCSALGASIFSYPFLNLKHKNIVP
jgi:hypothetical protein